ACRHCDIGPHAPLHRAPVGSALPHVLQHGPDPVSETPHPAQERRREGGRVRWARKPVAPESQGPWRSARFFAPGAHSRRTTCLMAITPGGSPRIWLASARTWIHLRTKSEAAGFRAITSSLRASSTSSACARSSLSV